MIARNLRKFLQDIFIKFCKQVFLEGDAAFWWRHHVPVYPFPLCSTWHHQSIRHTAKNCFIDGKTVDAFKQTKNKRKLCLMTIFHSFQRHHFYCCGYFSLTCARTTIFHHRYYFFLFSTLVISEKGDEKKFYYCYMHASTPPTYTHHLFNFHVDVMGFVLFPHGPYLFRNKWEKEWGGFYRMRSNHLNLNIGYRFIINF